MLLCLIPVACTFFSQHKVFLLLSKLIFISLHWSNQKTFKQCKTGMLVWGGRISIAPPDSFFDRTEDNWVYFLKVALLSQLLMKGHHYQCNSSFCVLTLSQYSDKYICHSDTSPPLHFNWPNLNKWNLPHRTLRNLSCVGVHTYQMFSRNVLNILGHRLVSKELSFCAK